MKRTTLVGVVAATALLAFASPAGAATRFAEPNGDGPAGAGGCPETDPCSIVNAIEDPSVVNGDEVVVLPGTYENQSTTLTIDNAITVRSRATDPMPVIPTTDNFGLTIGSNAVVRRLRVDSTAQGGATIWMTGGGTLEQSIVTHFANPASGNLVELGGNSLVRDSVLWNSGNGKGAHLAVNGDVTRTATLRNVTAVATSGPGVEIESFNGADLTIDAANTIVSGSTFDVRAATNSNGTIAATATLSNSNYDTREATGTNASVTDPTTNSNQTLAPVFANASAGDFHQLSTSPTRNAGSSSATLLGSLDLDGETRSTESVPDIGADEFVDTDSDTIADIADNCVNVANTDQANADGDARGDLCDNCVSVADSSQQDSDGDSVGDACDPDTDGDGIANAADNCPAAANADQADNDGDGTGNVCDATPDPSPAGGDASPPDTTITEGPSGKTRSKTATIAFSGTDARAVAGFQCRLDGGSFEPCSSPKTYSGLKKGRHTVEVRAVDEAGNVDPTPASRSWTIKKKKKKKQRRASPAPPATAGRA